MDNQALKDYFKFDDEDLQANKAGRFSAAQTRRLHSRQSGAIREKRIVSLIGIPLSLILLVVMVYLILSGSTANNTTNTAYVFWLGLCGLPMLLASAYIFRLSLIHQNYVLKLVQGPIDIVRESHIVDGHTYSHYELRVGTQVFHVDGSLGNVIMQGDLCAFYYAEGAVSGADEILTAEIIAKA